MGEKEGPANKVYFFTTRRRKRSDLGVVIHISTSLDFTVSPLLPRSSPLSDPEHRQLSLYAKVKPDHFHVYDADKYSCLSNEAYYPTWLLTHHHSSGNGMSISGIWGTLFLNELMVGGNGAWSRDQGHVPQTTNYDL
jgi:hypothetical protein